MLGGIIFHWLLLFQEYYFEVIVKPSKENVGPDHLSRITLGEQGGRIDDNIPYNYFFRVVMADE